MTRTPLHQATWSGERTRELIAEGFDINEVDVDGLTPLHIACINWRYDAAKVLLEAGADVDRQDKWGNTPLLRAVGKHANSLAMVNLFLEYGANPMIENNYRHSAVKDARRLQGTEQLIPVLESAARKFTTPA